MLHRRVASSRFLFWVPLSLKWQVEGTGGVMVIPPRACVASHSCAAASQGKHVRPPRSESILLPLRASTPGSFSHSRLDNRCSHNLLLLQNGQQKGCFTARREWSDFGTWYHIRSRINGNYWEPCAWTTPEGYPRGLPQSKIPILLAERIRSSHDGGSQEWDIRRYKANGKTFTPHRRETGTSQQRAMQFKRGVRLLRGNRCQLHYRQHGLPGQARYSRPLFPLIPQPYSPSHS